MGKRRIRVLGVSAILVVLGFSVAFSQPPAPAPVEKTVSVELERATLRAALEELVGEGGLNYVAADRVLDGEDQTVTVHLQDVPLREAAEALVRAAGQGFDWTESGVLIVLPRPGPMPLMGVGGMAGMGMMGPPPPPPEMR